MQETGRLKGRTGPWDRCPPPRQLQDWRTDKGIRLLYCVLLPLNSTVIIDKTGVLKAASEAWETKSLPLDTAVIRLQGWKSRRLRDSASFY